MKLTGMTPAAGSSRTRVQSGMSKGQGPTLATIQMIESAIMQAKEYPSRYKLWRSLPKGMHYETLTTVLNYLEGSNKIMFDKDGAIIWIFADNPKLQKLLSKSTPL